MRFSSRVLRGVLIVAALLSTSAPVAAQPYTWLVIGDSWGAFLTPVQRDKIDALGLPFVVDGQAIGGTTAQQWANNDFGLLAGAAQTLADLPPEEPAVVYVSLGGNDVLGEYATQGPAILDRVREDVTFVVRSLLTAKPNILVLLGSYDILNFDKSPLCQGFALGVFGTTDPVTVNQVSVDGVDLVEELAVMSPRVISLTVLGALQGSPGMPDLTSWSPAEKVTPDCIHLTTAGYTEFNDAMFDRLFEELGITP